MIRYIISDIISIFTSNKRLYKIASKLVNSVLTCDTKGTHNSIKISEIKEVITIGDIRFVKFIGTNVSQHLFEILLCDTGVISLNMNKNLYKQVSDDRYSLYIKEID